MSENPNQTANEKVRRAFFIDSENGLETLLEGYSQLSSLDMIIVFHRDGIADKLRKQLNAAQARIDWVQCGDPKIKNSMDFQIVTELAVRLAFDDFDEAYVVSRDKGFQAAVHHLEQQPVAKGHVLKCVKDISEGLFVGMRDALVALEDAECVGDIQDCLERALSKTKAKKIMPVLTDVILRDAVTKTEKLKSEPDLAVYEVPCEALKVPQPTGEKKSVAQKALHSCICLLSAIRDAGSSLSSNVRTAGGLRS